MIQRKSYRYRYDGIKLSKTKKGNFSEENFI